MSLVTNIFRWWERGLLRVKQGHERPWWVVLRGLETLMTERQLMIEDEVAEMCREMRGHPKKRDNAAFERESRGGLC